MLPKPPRAYEFTFVVSFEIVLLKHSLLTALN
jgi:hypothetical protein